MHSATTGEGSSGIRFDSRTKQGSVIVFTDPMTDLRCTLSNGYLRIRLTAISDRLAPSSSASASSSITRDKGSCRAIDAVGSPYLCFRPAPGRLPPRFFGSALNLVLRHARCADRVDSPDNYIT